MKIIIWGGLTSIHLQRWCQWLVDHDVDVLPMQESDFGILNYKISTFKPDIVHGFFVSQWGLYTSELGFHPYVISSLGSDLLQPWRYTKMQTRMDDALKKADLFIADCQDLIDIGVKRGADPTKSHIIPFGIKTDLFKPGYSPFYRTFHKTPDTKVILSIRHMSELYNHESIVRAMPYVLKEFPDCTLVNHAPGDDIAYQEYIAKIIEELGLSENVYINERVQYVRLPEVYNAADVVVSIPTTDGLAVSNLEAMACEKPVIATDNATNRNLLSFKGVVDPKNPEMIAQAIIAALKGEYSKGELGDNREFIKNHYEQDNNMGEMLELYRSLL